MRRFFLSVLLASLAIMPCAFAGRDPNHAAAAPATDSGALGTPPGTGADLDAPTPVRASFLPPLPEAPAGRTTVIGGVIRTIDPVLDEITLSVYGGGKPMKILFDERTKFYRDGVRTPLDSMRPNDHASVETLLDGDDVFAVSVHMLSGTPQGECEGQVLAFDPRDGEITLRNMLSGEPIRLRVEPRTTIARIGQQAFTSARTGTSDLMRGALISVKFQSDNKGDGIADAISILATPGSGFYFSGEVAYLNLQAGLMAITDPRSGKSYTIEFDPAAFPASQRLRVGSHVGAMASFNGRRYVASKLDVY